MERADGRFCCFAVVIRGWSWEGGEVRSYWVRVANSRAGQPNSAEVRHSFAIPRESGTTHGQLVEPPAPDRSGGEYRRWWSARSSLALLSDVAEDLGDSLGIKDAPSGH